MADLLPLLAFVVLAGAAVSGATQGSSCPLGLFKGTTLLFVADPGTFSGTPEAAFYEANINLKSQIPKGTIACVEGYIGLMMRQHVAVITTGIGPTASALCVYDVLAKCGAHIKDVFYSGTSGWSSQLGGVINNGSCAQANPDTSDIVRMGDVCVSPFSVNWDCRQASWQMTTTGAPNECTFPAQNYGPADSSMFGQCQFTDVSQHELALSDEVLAAAAAAGNQLPVRAPVIQALDVAYWGNMSEGTNLVYPTLRATAPPRIWSYKQCMEIDSQFFWSGAAWDMVARAYVSDTLNKGLGLNSYSQGDVIAVSAMEAIGLSSAMQRYNALASTRRRIPYTVVRGMSDWVHPPLINQGAGVWASGPTVEDFTNGYKYAISTATAVVLSTLQARCESMDRGAALLAAGAVTAGYGPKPIGTSCTFVIDYN